jgi:hypothetical protein
VLPFHSLLISSIPCRAIPLSLPHRKCPVRPTIPRIPTSLNFGAEGASTGTPIVLAGPSREHAPLRYVPTSLLKGCHGVILARATLDCLNFCCNCSSTLSVCHGRTTSDAPRVHKPSSVVTIPSARNNDRCSSMSRPFYSHLLTLPVGFLEFGFCICHLYTL